MASFTAERLEERALLAVGPFVHAHNTDELIVIDSSDGSFLKLGEMDGFAANDDRMSDIAFAPNGRLYGVTRDWLYEIDPVTAELFPLGRHNVGNANALVFDARGVLHLMGRNSPNLYTVGLTPDGTAITAVSVRATLSDLETGLGAEGDIAFMGQDLVVASTDNRLIWYRFDVNPDRPRVVRQLDLDVLGVDNVFGMAVVGSLVIATNDEGIVRINLANPNLPVVTEFPLADPAFGDLRGAAYFGEAGGPVPVGTLSGVKWNDVNGDGLRQFNEPVLADWPVFIDLNVNGIYNVGEPLQFTDLTGRYYFFGQEPGFYTVDEIIENPLAWEQTFPLSPHPNLVGQYGFGVNFANELFHEFGLPALTPSFASASGGAANLLNANSFLELPVGLGETPFTIVIDATYNGAFASDTYLLSQRDGIRPEAWDFELRANSTGRTITTNYCDVSGVCSGPTQGTVDGDRHQIGITWDGRRVGSYYDEIFLDEDLALSDVDRDADLLRFGNPAFNDVPAALRGVIHEIRIFNRALTEPELINAFSNVAVPSAYTVFLDGFSAADELDFGNREPEIIELLPEIDVRLGGVDGTPILDGGPVLSLGRATLDEPPPSALITVRNTGNTDLLLPAIVASSGFQIVGTPATVLQPLASTSFTVTLTDRTPGIKTGSVVITNNDANENPFTIPLQAEILTVDTRPRDLLILSSAGNLLQIDPVTGTMQPVVTGLPAMTDIAHHPTENLLYGINATQLFEINLATDSARPLLTHGVRNAQALAFSPAGELFLAGADVHLVNLTNSTAPFYATGGSALAGDLAFVGSRMLMSTEGGNFYEVFPTGSVRLGNTSNITLNGLASTDLDTLYGFADNRSYLVNLNDLSLTPQFNTVIFTIAGATYLPQPVVHNRVLPVDTTGDGLVTPIDALLIINELNTPTFTDPATRAIIGSPSGLLRFPDVTNDGFLTPLDALQVINALNAQAEAVPAVAAEGEAAMPLDADLLDLLSADLVSQNKRARRP